MANQVNKKSDYHQLCIPESRTSEMTSSYGPLSPPLGPRPPLPASFQMWKKLYSGEGSSGAKSPVSQPPSDGHSFANEPEGQETFEKNLTDMEARYMAMQGDAMRDFQFRKGYEPHLDMDPQRIKRVFASRISAQKSRMRKLQYMTYMESKIKDLQTMITKLRPQIASLTMQKEKLQQEKQFMIHQLNAYDETDKLKKAEIVINKAELKRLRELYLKQQQMQAQVASMNMIQSVGQQHFGYLNPSQVPYAAGIGSQLGPQQMPNPYVQQQEGSNNMEEVMNGDSFNSMGAGTSSEY